MEFKSFLCVFYCCAILMLDTTAGYPQTSSESLESAEGSSEIQQIQQKSQDLESLEIQKNVKIQSNKIIEIRPEPIDIDPNDICLQERQTGPCKGYFPRYALNKLTKKCERFTYGGCGGTDNNFKSLKHCETKCSRHLKSAEIGLTRDAADAICSLPAFTDGSACNAMIPRWTYDTKEGKCIQFMFGGCRGTKNNFENRYMCQRACGNFKRTTAGKDLGEARGRAGQEPPIQNLKSGLPPTCEQRMESGPCYGMAMRYFFSKRNNRCEKFVYGGCGGNDNNFETSDDCIRTCGGDTPSDDESCSLIDCPWNLYSHYETMGCKPIYDGQSCCPTRYDCPDANNTMNSVWAAPVCTYKDKSYAVGELVEEASITSSCRAACTCYGFGGKPRINCASIECPENLGSLPVEKRSCIRLYKRDSCCAHDFYCPNDNTTAVEPQVKGREPPTPVRPVVILEKYVYDAMEYVVGQRFYPKNGQCLTCTCLKGFNGTLGDEFCRKIDCGIEIYYSSQLERGCSPVYFKDSDGQDSCCPIGWQCPDEKIPMVRSEVHTRSFQARAFAQVPEEHKHYIPGSDKPQIVNSSVCGFSPQTGPCRSSRPRFFYNMTSSKCESFTYGGCKGNGNNFVLQSDCEQVCQNNTEISETPVKSRSSHARSGSGFVQPRSFKLTEVDPCVLPVKVGNCRAYFPRYFFSAEDNACKYFVYGGCGGNKNNFLSMESCEALCQNKLPIESLRMIQIPNTNTNGGSPPVIFNDETEDGVLTPYKPHTVIDITKQKSIPYDEDSASEESDTADICALKPVTGPCRMQKNRFYYDPAVKYCKRFNYGGCQGNANNFERLKDCDKRCSPNQGRGLPDSDRASGQGENQAIGVQARWRSAGIEIPAVEDESSHIMPIPVILDPQTESCKLPLKIGACYAKLPSYYYDVMTNQCKNFTYGGCFGNANRFGSFDACERTCRIPISTQITVNRVANPNHILVARSGGGRNQWGQNNSNGQQSAIIPNTNTQTQGQNNDTDFCLLDPASGYCKGRHLRYFWTKETSRCLPFFYTGCRGNQNNFASESECVSTCSSDTTIEQVTMQGVLTCSFGNETLSIGSTLGASSNVDQEVAVQPPCGVPICQCLTPPSLTCIQTACPVPQEPEIPVERNSDEESGQDLSFCPTPTCGSHCKPAVNPNNGCPTCDCDPNKSDVIRELVTQPPWTIIKTVKGH